MLTTTTDMPMVCNPPKKKKQILCAPKKCPEKIPKSNI